MVVPEKTRNLTAAIVLPIALMPPPSRPLTGAPSCAVSLGWLMILLLASAAASAQHAALSLDEAVELGLERAPQLQALAAAVDAAQAEAIAAGRLPDPELVLGLDSVPVEGGDAWSLERDSMTMRKLGVMQTFPNGLKRTSQREEAAAVVALAYSEKQELELEVARAAAEAWIGVHSASLVLARLRALRPEIELQARSTTALLASGRKVAEDVLAAHSAISELDDRLLAAELDVAAARARLARWIDVDADREFAPAPLLRELPSARSKLLSSIERQGPLLTYAAQSSLAQSKLDLARAHKRPDLSAQLTYANRAAPFGDMVSVELRIGLPLFGRYRQDPRIRARHAELAQIEADRQVAIRMQAATVASQLAAWDTARKRVELYETERLPLARQRSRAALAQYEAGRLELPDVLARHIEEFELQRSYAERIGELGQAWVFLRYLEPEQLR